MTAPTPRIAVLGCGGWGRNIARSMNRLGMLACVSDPSSAGLENAKSVAPDVEFIPTPQTVLEDESIDAVMIATPAETHYELASRAIEAGKDVFVEKPMTIHVGEAEDLVRRAAEADRVLMVGHLLEYHPAIVKLAELVRSGELGKIHYIISNRLNLGKIRTEENSLWSFAPHDIAVILRLLGSMPFEVVATGGNYITPNIADVTVTQLLFNNGVRSHIFVSWLHPFKEQKLVVVGSKKMATFDDVAKELMLFDQRVAWEKGQPVPVRGEGTPVHFDADEPLMLECEHFVQCVRTRTAPLTDGPSGLRVLQVLHAAQRSLMTNGRPVQITPGSADQIESAMRPVRNGAMPLVETIEPAAAVETTQGLTHARR